MLGQTLPQALEQLGTSRKVRVTETAPPFTPRGFVRVWGELRVLRISQNQSGVLELLVARELLREEKLEGAA